MKLTGKTKEDFLKDLDVEEQWFNDEYVDLFANALIIEFFDSVKIYISINYVDMHTDLRSEKGFQSLVSHKHLSTMFRVIKSRQEATEKSIEKANEIYNNKFA